MLPETAAQLREARRLDREGQYGRAVLAYKMVLRADPGCLEAQTDLGGLLMQLGRFEEALALCRSVLAERPGHPAAVQNLVGALMGLERFEEADAECRALLARDPGCAAAHLGLGMGLAAQDRHAEAEPHYRRALDLDPADPRIRGALFHCQVKQRAWDRLRPTWEAIAARDMEGPKAEFERAFIHLTYGELREGWACYESRFLPPNDVGPRLDIAQPLWDGAPFPGRTLLLHFEQGFGDTLMFARYLERVKALGGQVWVLVQAALLPLLRDLPWVDRWFVPGDLVPPFDLHLPLMSLARVFDTTLESIPAPVPYLRAPADPCPAEAAILPSAHLKVGLVWAGNTQHKHDFLRTLRAASLAPLFALPGIDWYSLQVGYEGGLPSPRLVDLGPSLRHFGDTARVLERLDLLITVDTAVAHLAGALGRPVWLMLALMPDWRWLLDREDSPWYPTARLFGQRRHDDWDDLVARIAGELQTLAATP